MKHFLEILHSPVDDKGQYKPQSNNSRQINGSQFYIYPKRHDHGNDQTEWRTNTHTQKHLVRILQIGHIRRHSCHQTGRAEFINIRKRKGLNIFKHGFPQILRKTGGRTGAVLSSHNSTK